MTGPGNRPGRHLVPTNVVPYVAPYAALLIDFDNVTMGVRSDLTKELKALLNSDIIKGKVTVQRAYADWRRYPQYVMPLTERSIDMIWATAVGSTKKTATDIRLAIDAMELVFTRPEIGTFIILSGDSDFSSLILKLKEYGKYVVGIGIRESASDLLIQNCDEYYSYSELAGLNKEVESATAQRDPWELLRDAVARMVQQGDVMRSDRLKQVMQQIDPNFDERNAGFNRFSKFVAEAANRGLVVLNKLDNGQFEVVAASGVAAQPRAGTSSPEPPRAASENGRRGRGRGRGRGRDPVRKDGTVVVAPPVERPAPVPTDYLTLSGAFDLLCRALGELPTPARHDVVRARMSALHGREDPLLEPERFSRLLRQVNDAEIAEVKKIGEDEYELTLSRVERARMGPSAPVVSASASPAFPGDGQGQEAGSAPEPGGTRSTLRFRRGSRGVVLTSAVPLVGVVRAEAPAPPKVIPEAPAAPPAKRGRGRTVKAAQVVPEVVAQPDPPKVKPNRSRPSRPRTKGKAA